MKKVKIIKRRVAALTISFFLTLGLTAPAFNFTANAEALEVANATCTVADMILSYCASGGVAVMNETVINEVYNVLGSSFGTLQTFVNDGLLTYSNGQYVDTGLSTNIASSIENINSVDIGALFNQTAQQNPAGVALTGAGSLAGIAGSVATTGVLPLTVGVAVSGYCGFQIGTIIANELGLYSEYITKGMPIDTHQAQVQMIQAGADVSSRTFKLGSTTYTLLISGMNGPSVAYKDSGNIYTGIYNLSSGDIEVQQYGDNGSSNLQTYNRGAYQGYLNGNEERSVLAYSAANIFSTKNEYLAAVQKWKAGTEQPEKLKSPDLIGSNGNLEGNYENNSYNVPGITPQVDPENESINPTGLTFDDWLRLAAQAQDNRLNNETDNNSDIFDDIMNDIRINTPTPTPSPSPDPDPDPDPLPNPDPETVPAPDVNPYPDTYPVPDPETVPDNKPQPEYTEKATENETDIIEGDPYTTPDLLNKFPFCIPRDILKVFKKLDSGARQAPHIQWRFNPNNMIDYTFDIDFSTWDSVATLLRILELAAFIIALGIATRNLILS